MKPPKTTDTRELFIMATIMAVVTYAVLSSFIALACGGTGAMCSP